MKAVQIKFNQWDKSYNFDQADFDLIIGDKVVVKTDIGIDLGDVIGFVELKKEDLNEELKPILRKATLADLNKRISEKEKDKALNFCKKMAVKRELPMKLVDANFSLDGSRITFAFIADGRIDFRELVKDLTRHFSRTIRLHQIGIRDEAKLKGDYGHCGMPLCCGKFLKELSSVTSEMAEIQQVAHRGSERISGVCGRLMCCLGYEQCCYEDALKRFPKIDSEIKIDGKIGRVKGWHLLKNTIDVEFRGEAGDDRIITEVEIKK